MTNSSNHDLQWRHPFSIDLNTLILLKIRASVYAPIPFVHALHLHYLDDIQVLFRQYTSTI